MSPEIQEAFGEIDQGLMRGIVLAPLGMANRSNEYRRGPLSWLVVQPSEHLQEWSVQYGEVDAAGNTRWSMPLVLPTTGQIVFEFFDFFDWRPYGVIDLPYVRVRIRDLPSRPDLQGLMALVPQRYCRFELQADSESE